MYVEPCTTAEQYDRLITTLQGGGGGKVVGAKSYLNAWGSDNYLDIKAMFKTTLTTSISTKKRT